MTYYVWSGSLKGTSIEADSPLEALEAAVKENLPCVLREYVRVSRRPKGAHDLDVYYYAPYEELLPELFSGQFEVEVAKISTT